MFTLKHNNIEPEVASNYPEQDKFFFFNLYIFYENNWIAVFYSEIFINLNCIKFSFAFDLYNCIPVDFYLNIKWTAGEVKCEKSNTIV